MACLYWCSVLSFGREPPEITMHLTNMSRLIESHTSLPQAVISCLVLHLYEADRMKSTVVAANDLSSCLWRMDLDNSFLDMLCPLFSVTSKLIFKWSEILFPRSIVILSNRKPWAYSWMFVQYIKNLTSAHTLGVCYSAYFSDTWRQRSCTRHLSRC